MKKFIKSASLMILAAIGVFSFVGCGGGMRKPYSFDSEASWTISESGKETLLTSLNNGETDSTTLFKGFKLTFSQKGENLQKIDCGLEQRVIHSATVEYLEDDQSGFVLKAKVVYDKRYGDGKETTEFFAIDNKLYEKTGNFISPVPADVHALSDIDEFKGLIDKAEDILPHFISGLANYKGSSDGIVRTEIVHASDYSRWQHYSYCPANENYDWKYNVHLKDDVVDNLELISDRSSDYTFYLFVDTLTEEIKIPSWMK